jgi:hypothetical protein
MYVFEHGAGPAAEQLVMLIGFPICKSALCGLVRQRRAPFSSVFVFQV